MQGIVLTSCASIGGALSALRANHVPLLKVVTQWGAPWDANSRAQVCIQMPEVIIRTVSGDGTRGPPAGQAIIFLDPIVVIDELQPWYDTRSTLWFELGNEPNAFDASDDAAWNFRYWFIETITIVRAAFPQARIISPGLIENRQSDWWAICRDAFALADCIGVHAYAYHNFTPEDTGQLQRALGELHGFFPNQSWMLTEIGINDAGTSPETKAARYGELHQQLPSQMIGACWYHLCDTPIDPDQSAYALPDSALPYLMAGGTV